MNIKVIDNEVQWAQKYRPRKINDVILTPDLKEKFKGLVARGNLPNMLLSGPPGVGKTTVAIAMLEELGCDYIKINGSLAGGIDTMRVKISNFAGTTSLLGGRKYVIIDEADYLSANAQGGFRGLIEDFSNNCGFILTCNYESNIIPAIRDSRMTQINFTVGKEGREGMERDFYKRVCAILDNEGVEYDRKAVAVLVHKKFPDFRSTLGMLEFYSVSGKIDEGILLNAKRASIIEMFDLLANRKFSEFRKWCGENNSQVSNAAIFTDIFNVMTTKVEFSTQPTFIVIMARYMEQHSRVADPEINFVAFLTEVMMECEFVK